MSISSWVSFRKSNLIPLSELPLLILRISTLIVILIIIVIFFGVFDDIVDLSGFIG